MIGIYEAKEERARKIRSQLHREKIYNVCYETNKRNSLGGTCMMQSEDEEYFHNSGRKIRRKEKKKKRMPSLKWKCDIETGLKTKI